jgi:hypothetical protein
MLLSTYMHSRTQPHFFFFFTFFLKFHTWREHAQKAAARVGACVPVQASIIRAPLRFSPVLVLAHPLVESMSIHAHADAILATLNPVHGVVDEALCALNTLYPVTFRKALDLVDDNKVSRLVCARSGRSCFEVEGSRPTPYLVLLSGYCSCPAFVPLERCKHELAARIALSLGFVTDVATPDVEFAARLAQEVTSMSSPGKVHVVCLLFRGCLAHL